MVRRYARPGNSYFLEEGPFAPGAVPLMEKGDCRSEPVGAPNGDLCRIREACAYVCYVQRLLFRAHQRALSGLARWLSSEIFAQWQAPRQVGRLLFPRPSTLPTAGHAGWLSTCVPIFCCVGSCRVR